MRPTPAKTLIALRQLALLGHGGTLAVPEAVGLLHAQIGFNAATLHWQDACCNVIDFIHFPDFTPSLSAKPMDYRKITHEHLAVALDYLDNFHNRAEGEGLCGYTTCTAHASDAIVLAGPSRETIRREYANSAFYERVIIPLGYGWNRLLIIRHSNRSPLGILNIGRSLNTPDFSVGEVRFLEQAQPWLEHLLRRDAVVPAANELHLPTGESVTLILDVQGKVLSASAGALALLHQAADMPLKGGLLRSTVQGKVDALLKRLTKPVEAAIYGVPALPPEARINNRWGRFYLRAYALSAFAAGTPLQISLHIERHVPLSLRLFHSPRFLALSRREREVCLHLLADRTQAEIARSLGVKPSTVIYFIRQIYQRLDINRQAELLPALLSEEGAVAHLRH